MRVRCIPALCCLTALLAACGTNGVRAGTTASSAPAAPTRAPATALTAAPGTGPRTEKWIDLQVGECVTDLPPADMSKVTVTVVDCGTAHLAEVYLRAPMAVDSAIANVANRDCAAGFASYTGQSVERSNVYSMTYLIDSNMDRTGGTPLPSTVICLVQSANGQPLTGSVRH